MKNKKTKNINSLKICSFLVLVSIIFPLSSFAQECVKSFTFSGEVVSVKNPDPKNCVLPANDGRVLSASVCCQSNKLGVDKFETTDGKILDACYNPDRFYLWAAISPDYMNNLVKFIPAFKCCKSGKAGFYFDFLRKPDIIINPCNYDPNNPETNNTILVDKDPYQANKFNYSFHYCFNAEVKNGNYKGKCSTEGGVAFSPVWPYKVYLRFYTNTGQIFSKKGIVDEESEFYFENGKDLIEGTINGFFVIPSNKKNIKINKIVLKIGPNFLDPQYGYIFSSKSTGLVKTITGIKLGPIIINQMESILGKDVDPSCKNPFTKKSAQTVYDALNKIVRPVVNVFVSSPAIPIVTTVVNLILTNCISDP